MKRKKRGGKSITGVVVRNPNRRLPPGPDPTSQSHLTDPDSRIMRKSKNEAFAQADHAQLAVDADGSQLVWAAYGSQSSADNNELKPMIEALSHNLGQKPKAVLADRG